jgi:hypothetical protein
MITRVAIPLLLLPLLALALPLMFALAWVQEAVGERVPPTRRPLGDCSGESDVSRPAV